MSTSAQNYKMVHGVHTDLMRFNAHDHARRVGISRPGEHIRTIWEKRSLSVAGPRSSIAGRRRMALSERTGAAGLEGLLRQRNDHID